METAKNTQLLQLSSADLFKMSLSNFLRLISLYNLQQLIILNRVNCIRNTDVDTHRYDGYNYVHFYVNTCTYEHIYVLHI